VSAASPPPTVPVRESLPSPPGTDAPVRNATHRKAWHPIKQLAYLPFRAVNLGLSLVFAALTLGHARPLLAYSAARMWESLGPLRAAARGLAAGAGWLGGHAVRAAQAMTRPAAFFRSQDPGQRPAVPVDRLSPLRGADAADVSAPTTVEPPGQETLGRLTRDYSELVSKVQRGKLKRLIAGSTLATAATAFGFATAVIALTVAMPPLGLAAAALGALALWVGMAHLKAAGTNLRRNYQHKPALPMGSSATANAWFCGIQDQPQYQGAAGREKARLQAATAARWIGFFLGFVQLAAGGAHAVLSKVVPAGRLAVRTVVSAVASHTSWRAATARSSTAAQAHEKSLLLKLNKLLKVRRGAALPEAVRNDLISKWKIPQAQLQAFEGGSPACLTPDDPVGAILKSGTHGAYAFSAARTIFSALFNAVR
jgi:hypothetical protein